MKERSTSGFFERVYAVVRMIPRGHVATYGQIAAIVSHRQAARTVGWALHALPDGTDVPWHRVINAQGMVSTSNRERAAAVQRVLLEREGVVFDAHSKIDLNAFQWPRLDWPEIHALRTRWNKKPPKPDRL